MKIREKCQRKKKEQKHNCQQQMQGGSEKKVGIIRRKNAQELVTPLCSIKCLLFPK